MSLWMSWWLSWWMTWRMSWIMSWWMSQWMSLLWCNYECLIKVMMNVVWWMLSDECHHVLINVMNVTINVMINISSKLWEHILISACRCQSTLCNCLKIVYTSFDCETGQISFASQPKWNRRKSTASDINLKLGTLHLPVNQSKTAASQIHQTLSQTQYFFKRSPCKTLASSHSSRRYYTFFRHFHLSWRFLSTVCH